MPAQNLEERVDERRYRTALRQQQQSSYNEQHQQNGEQPELFSNSQKSPEFFHERRHWFTSFFATG
jgi:hypothetical protein